MRSAPGIVIAVRSDRKVIVGLDPIASVHHGIIESSATHRGLSMFAHDLNARIRALVDGRAQARVFRGFEGNEDQVCDLLDWVPIPS